MPDPLLLNGPGFWDGIILTAIPAALLRDQAAVPLQRPSRVAVWLALAGRAVGRDAERVRQEFGLVDEPSLKGSQSTSSKPSMKTPTWAPREAA